MPHEIETYDNVLLHTERAWHGLGTIVHTDMTAMQALEACTMDWTVEGQPVFRQLPDGRFVRVENYVCNVRMDVGENGIALGMVSSNYVRIQNETLASFAESIASEGNVVIESCGSIRNGKRVWFLCRSEAFDIGGTDKVVPYLLVSNGHDGTSALRVTPTTVRVVCSNTLHMVIPDQEMPGAIRCSGISLTHTGNIMQQVDQVRSALRHFEHAKEATIERAEKLRQAEVRAEQLDRLFATWWERDFRPIPVNPTSKREETRLAKVRAARDAFINRFHAERHLAGDSMWNAFNAYTGLVQHDIGRGLRMETADQVESRMSSNLFGANAGRAMRTFEDALQVAG